MNKLGGVWVDDRPPLLQQERRHAPPTDYANIDLQPGYQHLTGKQALDFVRFRHTDSDLFRARAPAAVRRRAMRQQVSQVARPLDQLLGIVNDGHPSSLRRGRRAAGATLNLSDIKRYAAFARHLPHGHVFQVKIQNVIGYNELSASQSIDRPARVQQFMNPDVQASTDRDRTSRSAASSQAAQARRSRRSR